MINQNSSFLFSEIRNKKTDFISGIYKIKNNAWKYLWNFLFHKLRAIFVFLIKIIEFYWSKEQIMMNGWHGKWSIPGGRRKINETIWQNIIRETREETNLIIFLEKILFCQEISQKLNHIFFTTQYFSGKISLDSENSSFMWVKPDKIDEKSSVPHLREEVFSCLKVLNQPKMLIKLNK